ncbi:hypothetical protein PC116_g28666 [Phytophthora cactorum]|nr:hypothetical protein PC116_g28666 [Phytophthora cactorum]
MEVDLDISRAIAAWSFLVQVVWPRDSQVNNDWSFSDPMFGAEKANCHQKWIVVLP